MSSAPLDRRGFWLVASSLFFLVLVAGSAGWRASHTRPPDPVTLRVANQTEAGEVAILLDVTDPLSPAQEEEVGEWLHELEMTGLKPQQHVTLWVLGAAEAGGLQRRFARFYPGRESDPILHNPALSAAACESLFSEPLRRAIAAAAVAPPCSRSEILEAIRELSEQPEARTLLPKRLVVISDLEQNSGRVSFYSAVPDFHTFHRLSRFREVQADLRNVSVEVLYLARGTTTLSRGASLAEFWRAFFNACGARTIEIRRV